MGDVYSYKKIKQDHSSLFGKKTKKTPHLDMRINQKKGVPHLQEAKKVHPFLNKGSPFYLETDPTQNAAHLEGQKRKRSRVAPSKPLITTRQAKDLQRGKQGEGKGSSARGSTTEIRAATPISGKKGVALTLSESFVNLIMVDGQKNQAEKIFSQTLRKLAGHLQNHVERKGHKKKEIHLFDRGENRSLLTLSDRAEKKNVYHVLQKAVDNVKPTLQVRKVRIARSIYQVPFIIKKKRQEKSGVRWIIESAKKRSRHSGATFSERLASSVLEAFMAQGQARDKRDQLHRIAEANRAYLRYRWW